MFKKLFCFILAFLFLSTCSPCHALLVLNSELEENQETQLNANKSYIFQGSVEINKQYEPKPSIFTGETGEVEKGREMIMTVSSVLSNGYTQYGDEFFAEIIQDVHTQEGIVIPKGTKAHGIVSAMETSKAMGRDAYVTLDFDYLLTPDGRQIPIHATMTTKNNAAASITKTILKDTGYTIAGGLAGGLFMLKALGSETAFSSQGGTLAAGAGIGAIAGLGIAIGGKGKNLLLAPGDAITVKIKDGIQLPVLTEESLKQEEKKYKGLNIKITNINIERDPFGEPNTIVVSMLINNQTNKSFSSFDIALANEQKNVFYPSPFGSSDFWFTRVMPGDRKVGRISFSVNNPLDKHWLIFYDKYTRKPLSKLSLDNAKREIKKYRPKKKRKKFFII